MELFQNLLIVSGTTSVVILILSVLHPLLFKKYSAKWCYFIWLAIAIRLLIPFSISSPQSIFHITLPPITSQPITTISDTADTYDPSNTETIANQNLTESSSTYNAPAEVSDSLDIGKIIEKDKAKDPSPMKIIFVIWIVGCVIFSFYHLFGYLLYKKSISRWSIPIKKAYILDTLEKVKRNLEIKNSICIRVSKQVEVPMIVGLIKPVIWLPNEEYAQNEIEFVLRHELIHYKHHDIIYKAIIFLSRVVHWFNPVVHLMTFCTNIALESYCDDVVVKDKDICFRENYAKIILASIKASGKHRMVFSTYFSGNFKSVKTRIANIFDIRSRRKGVLAAAVMITLIAISSSLVACSSEKFNSSSVNPVNTSNLVNAENTMVPGSEIQAEDNVNPADATVTTTIQAKFAVDLTIPTVTFKDISTNIKNDKDIVDALEGQKLELNFKKLDMSYASFTYPSALCGATKKEMSQIKEVIKEKVIDGYKVIAYEDIEGGFYLGYIKDDVLYCLDSFDSERKHYFDSIKFYRFENVLGAEKGFVVSCVMGASYAQYVYYGIYNEIPQALAYCYGTIMEIDLDGDGMKEIVYSEGTARYTVIQVKRGNDVYRCILNEDIENKTHSLVGKNLRCIEVLYDENKNTFEFSIFVEKDDFMYDSIEGYAVW